MILDGFIMDIDFKVKDLEKHDGYEKNFFFLLHLGVT